MREADTSAREDGVVIRRRADAVASLESELGGLFVDVRRLVQDTAQRLQPGLSSAGYSVFTTIVRMGAPAQSDLVEALGADKAVISRATQTLEEYGLIRRTVDDTDRRVVRVTATEDGARRLAEARAAVRPDPEDVLAGWSVEDVERLVDLLRTLRSGAATDPKR